MRNKTIKNNRKNRKMLQMAFRRKIKQIGEPQVYQELIVEKKFDKTLAKNMNLFHNLLSNVISNREENNYYRS